MYPDSTDLNYGANFGVKSVRYIPIHKKATSEYVGLSFSYMCLLLELVIRANSGGNGFQTAQCSIPLTPPPPTVVPLELDCVSIK